MKVVELLSEARTNGMKVTVGQKYSESDKSVMIAAILHLISLNSLFVEEIKTESKGVAELVIVAEEVLLTFHKCEMSETRVYENRDDDIEELFSKMQFGNAYESYKNKWQIRSTSNYRTDWENAKKANEYLRVAHLVVNEEGHLLLAEDSEYNTVWAYVFRHKNLGTVSYGIYRRGHNGRPSKTELIAPAVVSEMGTKVGNLIKNYEGTFNSKNAIEATMKLWCWNLVKAYQIQSEIDEYDSTDIYEALKEWIIENAGKVIDINGVPNEPVYINQTKDRTDIGIWGDNLKWLFEKLEIEESTKMWLREAVKEKWIVPQLRSNGTVARNDYNPSNYQREVYNRKNKNERVIRFVLSDDEMGKAMVSYMTNKINVGKEVEV